MLITVSNLGLGPTDVQRMFPIKAFNKSTDTRQSPKALSSAEVLRLAQALKQDLVAIHRGTFTGPDSEALVVSFLVVALRTGINTTRLPVAESFDAQHDGDADIQAPWQRPSIKPNAPT
jgi:hypothetical protein